MIAFLSLDQFDSVAMQKVSAEIAMEFDQPVTLLPAITIPKTYYNSNVKQFCADSILDMLALMKPDTVTELIAITHQPIFTINESNKSKYYDQWIFGLGDVSGNICVISDAAFSTKDSILYKKRMKKVIMHETGHNMGLEHCKNWKCIMSERNGSLKSLDLNDGTYCSDCLKKLQQ